MANPNSQSGDGVRPEKMNLDSRAITPVYTYLVWTCSNLTLLFIVILQEQAAEFRCGRAAAHRLQGQFQSKRVHQQDKAAHPEIRLAGLGGHERAPTDFSARSQFRLGEPELGSACGNGFPYFKGVSRDCSYVHYIALHALVISSA